MLDRIIEKAKTTDNMEEVRRLIALFMMEIHAFIIELRNENIKKDFEKIHRT